MSDLTDAGGPGTQPGPSDVRVKSVEEAEQHIASLTQRVNKLEQAVSDHTQRFDTLQTRLWKRLWFRIQGWPGQNDLNASHPAWRPGR